MKISITNTNSYNYKSNCNFQKNSFSNKNQSIDSLELSYKNNKNVSFSGLFSAFFKKEPTKRYEGKEPTEFAKSISKGINKVFDTDIPASNFSSIMTPEELRELLPSLEKNNFIATKDNQDKGIYCIDLDYQTNFSAGSGKENVFDILDNVAEYANDYYAKTGKDFIFAITDRDCIEGIQHAIRIVGNDPEKFKHVKLLPGIKMSFAHQAPTSKIDYENSEMLIYGINPYSDNVINFVDNTLSKRKNMTLNFIKKVNTLYPEFAYNIIEFNKQNGIKYKRDYAVSNLYWRAREYAETKGDTEMKSTVMVPEKVLLEAENILDEIHEYISASDSYSAIGSHIIKENSDLNIDIKQIFDEYSTHYSDDEGKVISSAENLYRDMIECFSNEPSKPVLALSAPFYLSHYFEETNSKTFEKVVEFVKGLQEDSNGMLIAFESVVPMYDLDSNLTKDIIQNFNDYIKHNTNLYEVGGSFAKRNMEFT